ncbi:DUF4880 domain-containing protein [Sphingomonas sp. So64.6b]|uniref:FecR family protein n=1 Tax=Sphingomonas sp. So64.6b TaxID=2997354 RepID=UPI0016020BC9|nr:FecR domain-containing protein [Sphingomonas sp. So64.6b]QNA83169.1 DUF4880 domain-containing protein [Sphingomonas sp. So64.6b]
MSEAVARAESAAVWAARLADGRLPVNRQAEFEAWMAEDPRNAQVLEEIVDAWRSVEAYATSAPIMEMRQAAMASANRAAPRTRFWRSAGMLQACLAATLVLTLMGAGIWNWLQPTLYETGVGERRVVVLADGSKISLDGDSAVAVSFGRKSRELWLEHGRAKFDVAKDALRPFSVTAGDKVVVATGTAFSVERMKVAVRVILYEGHVAVLEKVGDESRAVSVAPRRNEAPVLAERALQPGSELVMPAGLVASAAPAAVHVSEIDPVQTLRWEGGQMVFVDEPLQAVTERMNRFADNKLTIDGPRTGDLRISGVFHAGDNEALIQGLAAFGVHARKNDRTTTLSLAR